MTGYERLAKAGTEAVQTFYDEKGMCADAARVLRKAIITTLEAPNGVIRLLALDENLQGSHTTDQPELVRHDDRWHFGIQIHLERPSTRATLTVAYKFSATVVEDSIRLSHDSQTFSVAAKRPDCQQIAEYVISAIHNDIEKGLDRPSPRMGF